MRIDRNKRTGCECGKTHTEKEFLRAWAEIFEPLPPEVEAGLQEGVFGGQSHDYYIGVVDGSSKVLHLLSKDEDTYVDEEISAIVKQIIARYAVLAQDAMPVFVEIDHDS